MTPEEFPSFVQRLTLLSDRIEAKLSKLDGGDRAALLDAWFQMLRACPLQRAMGAIQTVASDPDRPYYAEDYIRKIYGLANDKDALRDERIEWDTRARRLERPFFEKHGRTPTQAEVTKTIGCRP